MVVQIRQFLNGSVFNHHREMFVIISNGCGTGWYILTVFYSDVANLIIEDRCRPSLRNHQIKIAGFRVFIQGITAVIAILNDPGKAADIFQTMEKENLCQIYSRCGGVWKFSVSAVGWLIYLSEKI